ncbi:YtxH domain-containing protein [Actinomycetaceae bacterium WB03_NA08]|uniref:YtxH domain-containing protein n=1 Tax=Scrofimicrobium canadense TaxID=2652290 RepID=A0A6N7VRN2_9ACTO|nr:YtxH domain-containing protein [Scrofimicrobium canadense]MSS84434.1 YtxH domain-containing protein [Scrofimicrobium canadense]
MGTKTTLLVGLAVGYVLGTRAGRERYEQIKEWGRKLRDTPIVARPLDAAGEKTANAIRNKGNQISDAVADSVKEKMFGVKSAEIVVVERPDSLER